MDAIQVESARRERRIYLLTFLFNVIAGIILRVSEPPFQVVVGVISILSFVVVTWRFCRALGIGTAWSAINALFSPLIAILQLIVLLRIYAKRTRTGLTFLMGERVPSRT
jgi:hypothetical protein